MKKKLLSLVLAILLVTSLSLSALATSSFNKSVFDGAADISTKSDDMSGSFSAYSTSLIGAKSNISTSVSSYVSVFPIVSSSDNFDMYTISMTYYAKDWAFINKIIIKIGDNRYNLSDFYISRDVKKNATIQEYCSFSVTNQLLPMMQDLIDHRDEEIKVRLDGSKGNIDFVLTDDIKNAMINLYNLYVAGGGLNKENLDYISIADPTVLEIK
mgnify:CR=1 FL=1